jgi:hypothetical protein
MDISLWVLWTVELNDPIDSCEIKSSGSNVGAEQVGGFLGSKFGVGLCSLLLLLLSVQMQ